MYFVGTAVTIRRFIQSLLVENSFFLVYNLFFTIFWVAYHQEVAYCVQKAVDELLCLLGNSYELFTFW